MELREFARRILDGESLAAKLAMPSLPFTDVEPGAGQRVERPARALRLRISPSHAVRVPSRKGMVDPRQRVRILHAFANHELQAVELFAWAILAFPEAPGEFRKGLGDRAVEEQRHTMMYRARLQDLGAELGDFPVSGYFWSKVRTLTTPARFVCAMGLTFENANLDHTTEYASAARAAGDEKTARLFEKVGADEIAHVRFAVEWLDRWRAPGQSLWDAYAANVTWPLRGALARGKEFHPEGRRKAGLDDEFIQRLASADRSDSTGRIAK